MYFLQIGDLEIIRKYFSRWVILHVSLCLFWSCNEWEILHTSSYHNPIWYDQMSVLHFLFKFLFLASIFMSCLFIIFFCKGRPVILICKRSKNVKDLSNENLIDDIPFNPALQNQFSMSNITFGCHQKETELGFSWISLLLNISFNNFEFIE